MNAEKNLAKKERRQHKHVIQKLLKRRFKGGYFGSARAARVLIDRKCIRIDEGGAA